MENADEILGDISDQLYSHQLTIASLNASMFELTPSRTIVDYPLPDDDEAIPSTTSREISKLQDSVESVYVKIEGITEMHKALALRLNVTRKSEEDINGDFKLALNGLRAEMASLKKAVGKNPTPSPPVISSSHSDEDNAPFLSSVFESLQQNVTTAMMTFSDELYEIQRFSNMMDNTMTKMRTTINKQLGNQRKRIRMLEGT